MSKSIWDTLKQQPSSNQPKGEGEFFTIHYSTEKVPVRCGPEMTLQKALTDNIDRLGADKNRQVTWRDNRGVVPATTIGQPNAAYTASVSLETKGC